MSTRLPSDLLKARQLWVQVLNCTVTRESAGALIDPLLELLQRRDLDTQALTRQTLLVLASQERTRSLFEQPQALEHNNLLAWADPRDPAVRLFHLYLCCNLNTSLPIERSCCAILGYVLDHLQQPNWLQNHGQKLQPLIWSLLQQWQRNGGVWPFPCEAVRNLQSRIQLPQNLDPLSLPAHLRTSAALPPKQGQPLLEGTEQVAAFYERHPYPRWDRLDLMPLPSLKEHLAQAVGERARAAVLNEPQRVLVLGCGTGREAIAWAAALPAAQVDGLDISGASLRYAAARAQDLGITNVSWHQQDLQQLPCSFGSYDLVTACGVLHHLPDPHQGLSVANRLVRPGGLLKLALYSEKARKPLIRARAILRSQMHEKVSDLALSRARAYLSSTFSDEVELNCLLRIQDFFDLDGCWDLFFNPWETCFTLPHIARQLEEEGLQFLGFEWDHPLPLQQFRALFQSDPNAVNLYYWDKFESLFPDTFLGMYRFWCKRPQEP